MTDGELCDLTIGIDYNGHQHVLDPPIGYAEWLERADCDAYRFAGLPDEPGIYRVIAKHWNRLIESGFTVLQYEELRLVGSGTVVPVVHEAIKG